MQMVIYQLVFQVTVADFPMYELLDQHRLMIPGVLGAYPKLTAFMDAFEALPKIKEYMASDKFMKRPINNKVAAFKWNEGTRAGQETERKFSGVWSIGEQSQTALSTHHGCRWSVVIRKLPYH